MFFVSCFLAVLHVLTRSCLIIYIYIYISAGCFRQLSSVVRNVYRDYQVHCYICLV
jgi:hypothetical protein